MTISWTVFSKPWPDCLPASSAKVADWGFDGVELPVREDSSRPAEAERDLPGFAKTLSEHGVRISQRRELDRRVDIRACAQPASR